MELLLEEMGDEPLVLIWNFLSLLALEEVVVLLVEERCVRVFLGSVHEEEDEHEEYGDLFISLFSFW